MFYVQLLTACYSYSDLLHVPCTMTYNDLFRIGVSAIMRLLLPMFRICTVYPRRFYSFFAQFSTKWDNTRTQPSHYSRTDSTLIATSSQTL